jgi:hypothetical protein
MTTFECRKCKNTFNESERDKHELICLYSLQVSNEENTNIPCEKCGQSVPFESYAQHLNMCGIDQHLLRDLISNIQMNQSPFGGIHMIPSSNPEPEEPTIEDSHVEDDYSEEDLMDRVDDNITTTINGIKHLIDKISPQTEMERLNKIKDEFANLFVEPYVPLSPPQMNNVYSFDLPQHTSYDSMFTEQPSEESEFPPEPEPVTINHRLILSNIKNAMGHRIRTHLYGQQLPNSNYYSSVQPYSSRYQISSFGINSINSQLLPPELRSVVDIANLANIANQQRRTQLRNRIMSYGSDENGESYAQLMALRDQYGVVEIGVSDIDTVAPYYTIPKGNIEEYVCAIGTCPEDKDIKDRKFRKVICGHDVMFCDDCLTKWLSKNKKCPICMKNLEDVYNDLYGKVSPPVTPTTKINITPSDIYSSMLI